RSRSPSSRTACLRGFMAPSKPAYDDAAVAFHARNRPVTSAGSMPVDGEAGERYRAARVAWLARVCGLVSLAFVLPSFGLAIGSDGFAKALAGHGPQIVVPALLLAIARMTNALGGSRRAIDACDAATALVSCVGFSAVLVSGRAASAHPELV